MTLRETVREEFSRLLDTFVRSNDETQLFEASEFGWRLVEQEVGPEELVAVHLEAMQRLVGQISPERMAGAVLRGYQLLLEASMAYGLAYRDFLQRERQRRTEAEAVQAAIRQTLESISDAFYALDTHFRFTYVNSQAEHLLRLTRAELLGQYLWDLLPSARELEATFLEAETSQRAVSFAWQEPTSVNWYAGRIYPSQDGFSVYFRDVTTEKRREHERQQLVRSLARERALHLAVMGSMQDGLVILDAAGRVQYANPLLEQWFGVQTASVVGRTMEATFAGMRRRLGDPEAAWAGWERASARVEQLPRFDITLVDSAVQALSVQLFPVCVPGQATSVGVLLHDITPEREMVRTKDELVAVVSHELRSPLASVVGFTELLLARRLPEELQREYLEVILREGQRLATLVNDFLDLQRLESGKDVMHLQPASIPRVVELVVAALEPDPRHPSVLDVPGDLPLVRADPDRLQQVLQNLLSNARKYSPHGGEIRISARATGGAMDVRVQDQGLGIPSAEQARLFEKFSRLDGPERRGIKGTGLGLAIVKQLVEAQGGRVWVASDGPGRGATFGFTVPLLDAGSGRAAEQ